MVRYQALAYRPNLGRSIQMGSPGSLDAGDWLLLLGGAVVGGAGINGLVRQFSGGQPNAIGVLVDLVLAGVGLSLFVQKGKLAMA